jgi:predicted metallo-beta-lactamase superfamily hydrolase
MQSRSLEISTVLKKPLPNAEGKCEGIFTFSQSVPHGDPHTRFGTVMMTRIKDNYVFVHASDIQMLYTPTIKQLIQWEPDVVIASGPPVYIPYLSAEQKEIAQYNAEMLAEAVDTLILDHHVLRSIKGMAWVDALPSNVVCAADFMGVKRRLLEARRRYLYKKMPVPPLWHELYAHGEVSTEKYRTHKLNE